ncbi:response regulator [Pusillimonas sp. TS35]|uniref:response regulator n=1 Tax=Paracandidimonas lactea TaxID=2895524 RepID=UPI00136C1169|nr:response regulator [Paracandidimonas lactea]MYN13145.1 response regulator [Pusillimonas sp. TS35]
MRILIIEDDPLIGDGLTNGLRLLGYAVDCFASGEEGDNALRVVHYDAVVLDLGLPGEDGVSLLTRWRHANKTVPVVILTARDAVESRIAGLDAGADDYLIKPISLDELAARLRAVTRRGAGKPEPVWRHGELDYHPATHEVHWKGRRVDLTTREALLMELFLTHPHRVLTRDFIRDKLYDWDTELESNALEVFVHHLRKKIHPKIVRTVRGSGYALGHVDADS